MHNVSIFSVLLPLTLGLILYKNLDVNSRVLLILLLFAALAQFADFFDPKNSGKYIFYNIYTILDSFFWGYLFYRSSHSQKIRVTIAAIIVLQVSMFIISFSLAGMNQFITEFVCLNSLLQLLYVLSFFYERYKREEIKALEKEPMFWYCLGILIYAPTTYFHFVYYDIIRNSQNEDFKHLGLLHDVLNTSMYLIFTVGIYTNLNRNLKLINVFRRYKS